tara:strand:- start:10159 stop:10434 length:276 start_codon:yes stop_codon:yes gene_type:complete
MGYTIILSINYYNIMEVLKSKFSGSKYAEPLEFDYEENDNSLASLFDLNINFNGGGINVYDFIYDPKTNKKYSIFSKKGKQIIDKYKSIIF